ncbi:MAG: RtcB family protein [Clostridia bacterium]|nr:RtcB family protein [Clostridia bacterium]
MIKLKGKYNEAIIYTSQLDDKTKAQITELCDFEAFKDSKIRIMPDVHAGKGCTIGTTMTIKDKIVPNMVGVDIGCGMELVQIAEKDIDFQALDEFIHKNIPAGTSCRKTAHPYTEQIDLNELRCKNHIDIERALLSIGSLGGGNHFIEMDKDDEDNKYIVIHSGSRRLGKEVAEYYQKEAYNRLKTTLNDKIEAKITELKENGKEQEIEEAVIKINEENPLVPNYMAYVEGQLFEDYIHDMKIVQKFAVLNRKAMIDVIVSGLGYTVVDGFTCIHNYIDTENMILRKGSVSAQKGEKILIPINMRDGALICVGKGNPDWNFSAPHGAGRILSRMSAMEKLSLEQFKEEMQGIYSTSVTQKTLDESPMAYKSMDDIVNNIEPTAEIVKQIKPIYNFKASN